MKTHQFVALIISVLCIPVLATAQNANTEVTTHECPMHKEHTAANSQHTVMEKNGDEAMGFSHDKTTHHFRISADGGAIEVTANNANDKASTEAIRSHLTHIAVTFGEGDFSTPMYIHDVIPPGATTMKLLKSKIRYKYEEMSSGGKVRIESSDPIAIAAIHDFLRFQISEHQTGDPMEVAVTQ